MRAREEFTVGPGSFRRRSSALFLPATFELAASGPAAAQAAVDLARRLSAKRHAEWTDPFLGFVAGAIAFAAGDWDGAVAELDSALERAAETGTGWISQPAAVRAWIDAHRGDTASARARLESFRHRGLPLQFGHDRPGWAELAVLEAEGSVREAATLARTLWSAARTRADRWAADLPPTWPGSRSPRWTAAWPPRSGTTSPGCARPAYPAWSRACSRPTPRRSGRAPRSSPAPAA
jgi:hypothetical protein